MKSHQILILFSFLIFSFTINKNDRGEKLHTISADTLQLIDNIKKEYLEINSKGKRLNIIEKDLIGQSSEGGFVVLYFDNKNLKKIVNTTYGETGKEITEYYLNDDGLFFSFRRTYSYDKPINVGGSKISSIKENRYYFFKKHLIRWLDNKRSVNSSSREYKYENANLLLEAENFRKYGLDYVPIVKQILKYDTVRCKYGIDCPVTGYIIKGSRDDKGRVIHVSPKNKNVPLEK